MEANTPKSNLIAACCLVSHLVLLGCAEPEQNAGGAVVENQVKPDESPKKYGDSTIKKLQAEFDSLLSVVDLSESKEQEVRALHQTWTNRLDDWHRENGPTIVAIRKKALEAAKKKDLRALKKMDRGGDKQKVADLTNEEREMLQTYEAELEATLPEPERTKWQRHVVTQQLLEFLQPLELTQEQQDQIGEQSGNVMNRVKRKENWRGYGTAELEKVFERNIVSPQQKTSFEELKKKNRMRMLKWGNRF